MTTEEIKEQIKKSQEVIDRGVSSCKVYKNTQDGSYNLCLDFNGVFEAKRIIKEMEGKLNGNS